jgi:hypothetical protein
MHQIERTASCNICNNQSELAKFVSMSGLCFKYSEVHRHLRADHRQGTISRTYFSQYRGRSCRIISEKEATQRLGACHLESATTRPPDGRIDVNDEHISSRWKLTFDRTYRINLNIRNRRVQQSCFHSRLSASIPTRISLHWKGKPSSSQAATPA